MDSVFLQILGIVFEVQPTDQHEILVERIARQ